MRILMVLDHNFPPDHRVEREIEALQNNNHEIVLACYSYKENRSAFEELNGVSIYRKKISKLIYKSSVAFLKFPVYYNFWKRFIDGIFNNEQIDVVHIHDLPLAKLGVYLKKRYGAKLVVDLHENWPASVEMAIHTNTFLGRILSSTKQWHHYEKTVLKKADAVITVVEEMRSRIMGLDIDPNKIYVVSNTINPKDFPLFNYKPNSEKITMFYAGGINIHRGLQIVIKALKLIIEKQSNVVLNIVGKGSYQPILKKLVSDLNLSNHVNFLGWKSLEEISQLLAKSNIALIPHLKSVQTDCSSPNKIYQYIYAKKPILTSNCNSLVRIVNETKSGISYIYNSPEDFKRAFIDITEGNDDIDLEFGAELITQKYNWSVDAKKLINLYNSIRENF